MSTLTYGKQARKPTTHLRRARLHRDETQAQVAQATGITSSYYSRIESGSKPCTPAIADALARHFENAVTRDQLLFPQDYPVSSPNTEPQGRSP